MKFAHYTTELLVSFERPTYTANEEDETVQVCFLTNSGHPDRDVLVTVQAQQVPAGSSECTDFPAADGKIISFFNCLILCETTTFCHFQEVVISLRAKFLKHLLPLLWVISSVPTFPLLMTPPMREVSSFSSGLSIFPTQLTEWEWEQSVKLVSLSTMMKMVSALNCYL